MKNVLFKGLAKNTAITIVATIIIIVLLIALLLTKDLSFNVNGGSLRSFLGIETRAQQEDRLKVFASSLPLINDEKSTYHAGFDGECSELTNSSALAAIRTTESLDGTDFKTASADFVDQTKRQGIEWYGNQSVSKPFVKDGKTYKLMILNYQQDSKIGIEVTACN